MLRGFRSSSLRCSVCRHTSFNSPHAACLSHTAGVRGTQSQSLAMCTHHAAKKATQPVASSSEGRHRAIIALLMSGRIDRNFFTQSIAQGVRAQCSRLVDRYMNMCALQSGHAHYVWRRAQSRRREKEKEACVDAYSLERTRQPRVAARRRGTNGAIDAQLPSLCRPASQRPSQQSMWPAPTSGVSVTVLMVWGCPPQ